MASLKVLNVLMDKDGVLSVLEGYRTIEGNLDTYLGTMKEMGYSPSERPNSDAPEFAKQQDMEGALLWEFSMGPYVTYRLILEVPEPDLLSESWVMPPKENTLL